MGVTSIGILLLLAASPRAADPHSEAALVQEVRSINDLADHRPTHVSPPLAGTFAAHAEPYFLHLSRIARGHVKEAFAALDRYTRGAGTWQSLSPELRALVHRALPEVTGLLLATHAASGRLPTNLNGLLRVADPRPEDSASFAFHVAAAEVRHTLDADPAKALQLCADGLALARDLSYGNALAHMLAAGGIQILTPACLAALNAQTPSPTSCASLQSIARHTAPMSALFEQEKVFAELTFFGASLDGDTKESLPPEAQRVIDQPQPKRSRTPPVRFAKLRGWLFGGWARRDLVDSMDALIAVADHGPSAADPVLLKLEREPRPWSYRLWGSPDDSPVRWLQFARRWRGAQTRLNALSAACTLLAERSSTGWPSLPASAIDARNEHPLRLRVDSSTKATLIAEPDLGRNAEQLEFALTPK